jgi:hypothetical protein
MFIKADIYILVFSSGIVIIYLSYNDINSLLLLYNAIPKCLIKLFELNLNWIEVETENEL